MSSPAPPAPAVSYAQLKAALWAAGAAARVHAVVDGRVVPGLPGAIEAAQVAGWDCLQRGALTPAQAAQAAYLVELAEASPYTDWLLAEAPKLHPGWGVVLSSRQPMLAMREHCRSLGDVLMPDGSRRPWRWHDPELLAALLPDMSPSQHDEIFAAGQQIIVPGPTSWQWYWMDDGVLQSRERPLLVPATA